MYRGKHHTKPQHTLSLGLVVLTSVGLLAAAPDRPAVVLFGEQTPRPQVTEPLTTAPLTDAGTWTPSARLDPSQVTSPSVWQATPFDDAAEWVAYVGIDTALVTSWRELGYVPTEPITGPDDVVHVDCYVLVGDTSYVTCLDGFTEES